MHRCCNISGMPSIYLCLIHSGNISDWHSISQSNGLDKNASVIYSGTGPDQTLTDSMLPERDPVHGLKACVNFIEIGTYQPVISFPVMNGRKFKSKWYMQFLTE